MPTTDAASIKEYYRKIVEVDIAEVAQELLGNRITQKTGQRFHCDCPNHASGSKQSLHIMLDKQGWYCFGCGLGGDVLQLVEFIESKTVTSGHGGAMPDTHRAARDYLAKKAGLPPLSQSENCLSPRIRELGFNWLAFYVYLYENQSVICSRRQGWAQK